MTQQDLQGIADSLVPGSQVRDPQAFTRFLEEEALRYEAQTGEPRENSFRSLFNRALSRLPNITDPRIITTALTGAPRNIPVRQITEGFAPQARSFEPVLTDPNIVQPSLQALDTYSKTSGGIAAENLAPLLGAEAYGADPNAFDAFIANLQAERESQSIIDALRLRANEQAFRQTEFAPGVAPALEIGGDLTNLIPGAAVARGVGLAGRAAPRAAGEAAQTVATTGARPVVTAAQRGEAVAAQSAAREATRPVVPFGPDQAPQPVLPPRPLGESLPPYRQIEPGVPSRELIERQAEAVDEGLDPNVERLPRRGREQILRRIDLATRVGGGEEWTYQGIKPIGVLNVDEARAMRELVEALPDEYFADTSLSIRSSPRQIDFDAGTQPVAGGAYDPNRGLIELFHRVIRSGDSPYVDDVFIHEVAHNLTRFVPEKDLMPLRAMYQQQKRAFDSGKLKPPQRLGSDATNLKYRFSSFDEWFAETFTDRALMDLFPDEVRRQADGVFARVRNIAVGIYNWLRRRGRNDAAERVYKSLIAGENRKRIRPGTFGQSVDEPPGGIPAGAAGPEDVTPASPELRQVADLRGEVTRENPLATIQQGLADPASVAPEKLRAAAIEVASPDGGALPPVPGGKTPAQPSDFLERAIASKRQGTGWKWNSLERTDQALLRLHDAAINVETRRARDVVTQGNERLGRINWGTRIRGTRAPKTPDDTARADAMYRALHGEGEAPPGMEDVVGDLRAKMDFESAQRIDFDPEMATVEDYFYRGWKAPDSARTTARGQLVYTPNFKKPRANATYSEMREAGFEPLFWNPYEQWNVARMQGVRYRQQMQLVEALKQSGDDVILPHRGGNVPDGWRVPRIGPAFEGKPILIKDELTGEVVPGAVRQWIVPDRIANSLESAYGKKPDLGTVSLGSKDVQIQKLVDWAVFTPKRAKLLGSVFQQVDFATRAGIGTAANMVDLILRGRPDLAIRDGLKYPPVVVDMLRANFSPSRRAALRRTLDSTEPIVKDRPGVTMRSLMEQGLSIRDSSLIPQDIDKIAREAASGAGVLGNRAVRDGIAALEKGMRDGLFEGVYPAAITYDARNVTGPMMNRLYGKKLSDAQLSARIAAVLNTKYSTIPETMSVVQNRFLRETMRRFFFSVNEQEGLLRQAVSPFRGADKGYWARHWIGAAVFLLGTANAIHFASTGQPLPKERYIPVSKRGYNTRFASPDLPFNAGRSGLPATLDIVGQMDTAFRVLDPKGYIESRFSVPVSAAATQWSGENYYEDRVDEFGPGGVVSRTAALANDLFAPIGAGPLAGSALREVVPAAGQVIPAGESRLGVGGQVVQATGLNLRAYNFDELQKLKQSQPEMAAQVDRELTMRKIDDAVRHVSDPTHILGTTNNLKARLREAQALGYESAIQTLEKEIRRREERSDSSTGSSGTSGGRIVVPAR